MNLEILTQRVLSYPTPSAWRRGVQKYALEMLGRLRDLIDTGQFNPARLADPIAVETALLDGCANWKEYSHSGRALVDNLAIAERLCNHSELRDSGFTDIGFRPHKARRKGTPREPWLDTQARALQSACLDITTAIGGRYK